MTHIAYGYRIDWTDSDGTRSYASTNGHRSPAAARDAALRMAKAMGWTPPRWWQWWRWDDTQVMA